MSLLQLGAEKLVKQKDRGKKKKDDSFLIHFKIPYVVTPVKDRKKKAKKYHGHHHHHHKHHPKKYHHAPQPKLPPNPPAHRPVLNSPSSPYGQQSAQALQQQGEFNERGSRK